MQALGLYVWLGVLLEHTEISSRSPHEVVQGFEDAFRPLLPSDSLSSFL